MSFIKKILLTGPILSLLFSISINAKEKKDDVAEKLKNTTVIPCKDIKTGGIPVGKKKLMYGAIICITEKHGAIGFITDFDEDKDK